MVIPNTNLPVFFPRAIISRHKCINPDFNFAVPGVANACGNVYFAN
jgi:hypothetical protein